MKEDNQKKAEGVSEPVTTHLYGLRRNRKKKILGEKEEEKMPSGSKSKSSSAEDCKPGSIEKIRIKKEDINNANSKEKRKKKSRKRKSKQSQKQNPSGKRKKKASGESEDGNQGTTDLEDVDQGATELEDVHQGATDVANGGVDHESSHAGVVFMNIKEEVIDPEYERVLQYTEVDTEDGPLSFPEPDEEDEFFPQTDDDEEAESAVESGLRFSDMGDGVPLIMEIKQEVEDQGYAVINQWDEGTISDFQKSETSPCSFDIKTESIDDDNQSTDNCYNEDALTEPMYSHLKKFLLHKLNFWVFHCPLCSSQQVFLHRSWLQQHLEEPFHKEKGKISPESQELLQDLLLSEEEQFCPVVTCQVAVEGGVEEFCKHLLSEHIDTLIYIRKLCQINIFCQETGTESKTKYSLTVQLNSKWHTFYRTKESSEIQTLIKEDSVEFFPVAKIVDTPKMKMTVRVNKNPIVMKPRSTATSQQVAPRDTSSFCFDDITYYKCPICPSLTVFFDVLSLKTHMIKKSHQLSSVCRVLKEIGVQHPTHTCPVLNCDEDFGKSQKKQLKHIMTMHPEKYDILKTLIDGCYQNFQNIAGVEGCIGGLQGLGIPQPQTINVTYRSSGGKLPILKPKPPSTLPYQNPIILGSQQQQSTMIGSLQPTSGPAVFTSMQSPAAVAKSKLQMFPSSQTVRQILDSKLESKKRALDSGDGSSKNGEVNTSSNGITTLALPDSLTASKPRPVCYKCGVNALSNIGLISHLFSDHCNLICKICSFTAEPLKVNNNILKHMKDVHNIDPCDLELNIWQSVPDIYRAIGVSQLEGLSCITQKKFVLDELVVHYALVDASSSPKFPDDLIVRQVKKEGDEVWIEILVGVKRPEESARLPVIIISSLEVNLEQGKYEDVASAGENSRNMETGLSEMMKNEDIATSSESLQSDSANPTSTPDDQSDTMPTLVELQPEPEQTTDNDAIASDLSPSMKPIGRQADIERVSPSSGYNSPIRRWLIQESIKEIRLEKLPFVNALHCLRCQVTASTNRGFLLHIFACHSLDVCKLCFYDLSRTRIKDVKLHLSTHPEYDRNQPVEDFMTLSCPEFMQLLGIPSLDQLCNITRDRIIFTFRVVWYRMAQICFESESKIIMQRNLTVNSSPKAGTPDIILFFKNKHHSVIQVDNESDSEVTKETSFRPENSQVPCIATEERSKHIEVVALASEVKVDEKCSSSSNDTDLETTRQFVEGKDFTIVLQGNDRVFKCLKCTRAYWNKCKMRRHLKVHLNIRNYQCHLCQKCFHYNYHLKAHMNIHNNSRPYKCNKCSKSYNNSGSLSWHVRQCHGLRNSSKNKVAKIQCQVCYIQVRQELYHEHLRERHGVSVAYQYVKSDSIVPEGEKTEIENEKTEVENEKTGDGQDTEDDTSQDEFPWRGELIVDEGDADDEPDSYDLAPATAQNVFTVDDQAKDTQESYDRQEVFQCTFCNMVYSNLPEFSMHTCPGRHNQTNSKVTVSKKSLQNYTETYTCSNCKRTSLLLETFIDSSHPCALNSVSNFMCEKTYTCKLCQLIFTNLLGVQKHACENADKQIEESDEEPEPEPEVETQQVEPVTDLSADLTCPVCSGVFSMTDMPYHLSSKHHLNRKVVFELMHQNNIIIKK